jgi:FAD synthetase
MGLATTRPDPLEELSASCPSVRKALDVVCEGLIMFCGSSGSDLPTTEKSLDLSKVMIAFNGGKDCTVLLHLVQYVVSLHPLTHGSLRLLYIREPAEETFREEEGFVRKISEKYGLELIEIEGSSGMRDALSRLVTLFPEVRAIFMGTRSTDPNAGWMTSICHTSPGWPQVDLISPLLPMTYSDIWLTIQSLGLSYCSLYDQGYTSIGKRSTTVPNPLLRKSTNEYAPAYELTDESAERLGRT